MSLNGGTSKLSSVTNTSFHSLVMTIIIALSVRVCFMIAKLSSKYVRSGFNALSTSACVGAVDAVGTGAMDVGRPDTFDQ